MTMKPEMLKADPKQRRLALVVLAGGIIVGIISLWGSQRYLDGIRQLSQREPQEAFRKAVSFLKTAAVLIAISTAAFSVYLAQIAVRTLRARRFPPAGLRLWADTPLLEGPAAARRGTVVLSLALVLGLSGDAGRIPDLELRQSWVPQDSSTIKAIGEAPVPNSPAIPFSPLRLDSVALHPALEARAVLMRSSLVPGIRLVAAARR